MWRIYQGLCKECSAPFSFSEQALVGDINRGLSPPSRCPACRKKKHKRVNSIGVAFWDAPRELNPSKQQWDKFGLMKLDSNPEKPKLLQYPGTPLPGMESKFTVLDPVVDSLIANLEDPKGSRVSVLVGPTGTGKSVWATYRMLRSKVGAEGRICVTQPRLITLRKSKGADETSTTPGFISKMLLQSPGVGAGQEIGFRYQGEYDHYDRYTRLLFVTDGTVIRWLVSGEIRKFTVLVIDEAHELSTNMVLILSLLRYQLPLYPRLRLVVASATANIEMFRNYFAPVCPEGVFVAQPKSNNTTTPKPIHRRWPTGADGYGAKIPGFKIPESPAEVPQAAAQVVKAIRTAPGFTKLGDPNGDILIFVPTIKQLRETVQRVEALKLPKLEALPCYAKMPEEENRRFRQSEEQAAQALSRGEASNTQRVIVATNYAETGVTLSNLRFVIDSGYTMEPIWNPSIVAFDYPTKRHSQAGCKQREGRVGRVQDGEVFKLFKEEDFNDPTQFVEHTLPEIARTPLDKFLLTAKAAGITSLGDFNWLGETADPATTNAERNRALAVLKKHGTIDGDGDITRRGVELERVQTNSVDLSMCLSESDAFACSLELATFFAFLDQPRGVYLDSPQGAIGYAMWRTGCLDDLEYYLRIFTAWEKAGRDVSKAKHKAWSLEQGFNHAAFEDIANTRKKLISQFVLRTHTDATERLLDIERLHRSRLVLAKAIPEWVYVKDTSGIDRFIPHAPEDCPCQQPLHVSENSTCLGRDNMKAFISFERRQIFGTVYAEHIVQIAVSWLPLLKTAKPLSLALLLRQQNELVIKNGGSATPRVMNPPQPLGPMQGVAAGDTFGGTILREMPAQSPNSDAGFLMQVENTMRVAHVCFKGERRFSPGTFVRAIVMQVSADNKLLVLDDDGFAKTRYPVGHSAPALVHSPLYSRDTEEHYGYLVQLERGVLGRLVFRNMWQNPVANKPLSEGASIEITVKEHKDSGMELELAQGKVTIGESYNGVVVDFLPGGGGYLYAGAFVEFAPRVVGLVHYTGISAQRLRTLQKGDALRVQLQQVTQQGSKTKYQLVAL